MVACLRYSSWFETMLGSAHKHKIETPIVIHFKIKYQTNNVLSDAQVSQK